MSSLSTQKLLLTGEAVEYDDDDWSVITIKISNTQLHKKSRDSGAREKIKTMLQFLLALVFMWSAVVDHNNRTDVVVDHNNRTNVVVDHNNLDNNNTRNWSPFAAVGSKWSHFAAVGTPWKVLSAFVVIGITIVYWLCRKTHDQTTPSTVFAVSIEKAESQLSALLGKVEERDRGHVLSILKRVVEKAEKKEKNVKADRLKSVFAIFDATLEEADFEFHTTLNFSRSTGMAAIERLQIDYPPENSPGLYSDDSSTLSTTSAKEREKNSSAIATAPPVLKRKEQQNEHPAAEGFPDGWKTNKKF